MELQKPVSKGAESHWRSGKSIAIENSFVLCSKSVKIHFKRISEDFFCLRIQICQTGRLQLELHWLWKLNANEIECAKTSSLVIIVSLIWQIEKKYFAVIFLEIQFKKLNELEISIRSRTYLDFPRAFANKVGKSFSLKLGQCDYWINAIPGHSNY